MTTRELIKSEIDQVQEQYLAFLHRVIQALRPGSSSKPETVQKQEQDDSWEEFLQSTYGIFHSEPLERGPQGKFEIREELE